MTKIVVTEEGLIAFDQAFPGTSVGGTEVTTADFILFKLVAVTHGGFRKAVNIENFINDPRTSTVPIGPGPSSTPSISDIKRVVRNLFEAGLIEIVDDD